MDRILNDQLIELVLNTLGTTEQLAEFFGLPVTAIQAIKKGLPPARYNQTITAKYVDKRTPLEKQEGLRLQTLRKLGSPVQHIPQFPRTLTIQAAKLEMKAELAAGRSFNFYTPKKYDENTVMASLKYRIHRR